MQVTIFGASGKVGRLVVEEALRRGHTVIAVIHQSNPFSEQEDVQVVHGDIRDSASLTQALQGSQAVISCLGSWGSKKKDVVSAGTDAIVKGMEHAGVKRIITVTGAGAHWEGDDPGLSEDLSHSILSLVADQILVDGEKHLATLAGSTLDWTCIRSPVMTKATHTDYALRDTFLPPWAMVPRAAVARCMVDQLEQKDYIHQAPFIIKSSG